MSERPRRSGRNKSNPFRVALAVVIGALLLFLFSPLLIVLIYPGRHECARMIECQSNMKQLGLALDEYTQDADGVLPPSTAPNGTTWRAAIYPFVRSTRVYQCPDDLRHDYTADNLPRSYAANHLGPDGRGHERGAFAVAGQSPVMLTQFNQLGKTIFLCDTQASDAPEWNMVSAAFRPGKDRELYAHDARLIFYERPGVTLNCLFADGHVKRLKPVATLSPVNLWTRDNSPFTGTDLQNAQAILKHAEDE